MKVISDRIGNTNVYIQTLQDPLVVVGDAGGGRATQLTSIDEDLRDAYQRLRSLIKELAQDFGTELQNVAELACPNNVEMEFSLGISAEGKLVWLVTGKGEFGLKVKLTWNLGLNEHSSPNPQ